MGTQRISAASGLASAGATWVGGVAPVDGDFIKIMSGHVVTQDVNRTYGDLVQTTYHAVDIQGTSGANFGEFKVNDGVTLTLRGTNNDDTGPAYNMNINQWGKFSPQPGATILFDVPTNGAGALHNDGIINAIGTVPKPVTFDIPAANKDWTTAYSYSYSANGHGIVYMPFDRERSIGCGSLNAPCFSNAAGTDIGTPADSSVSFSAVTPAGILTTPVASIAAVNSVGKYFVDHQGGFVFFYTSQADGTECAYTVAGKKLAVKSIAIRSRQAWDGNQAVFRYCNLTCIGTGSGSFAGAIQGISKTNAAGTTRRFEVTHCLFKYSGGIVLQNGATGIAGDPILIEDNEFYGTIFNAFGAAITITSGSFPYLSIKRNKVRLTAGVLLNDYFSDGAPSMAFDDNVSWTNAVITKANKAPQWIGADVSGNAMIGRGGMDDARMLTSLHGTLANPTVLQNNIVWRGQRAWSYGEYNDLFDNVFGHTFHHMVMAQDAIGQGVTPRVRMRRNIAMFAIGSGALEVGYNYDNLQDGPEIEHNTLYQVSQALSFGDQSDSTGMQMQLGYIERSNMMVGCDIAVRRPVDVLLQGSRTHIASADYNNIYGSTTADFGSGHFARFCTPSGIVNCAGVSLFNPSFAAPVSGKTLAYVIGSATSRTLAWDGGAPVQLYRESGQVTSAEANAAWPDLGYLNDTSKAWPVNQYSNAASPVGAWVVITGGTGAGQARRVLYNNTGTRLILAYGWTTPLDATSTYQIWRAEVTLSNAGATQTIDAGIDWRMLPSTSQSDNAVAIAFNGRSFNPQFVDPTRNLATWDLSLGGPGTEEGAIARLYADPTLTRTSLLPHIRAGFAPTNAALATAAHDSTTIGAVDYFNPNAPPNQPTIASSGVTSSGATLTGSAFADPDTGDTHAASQWQVTTSADSGFATPIVNTGDDAVNKTSYSVTGLSAATPYRARVRYKDSAGNYSPWATATTFTTASVVIATHLVFYRQPGNTSAGGVLNPQPIVRRVLDSDGSLSTDTSPITISLIPITGGPATLNGTKIGNGPEYAPTDLYLTGTPGSFKLEAD